VAGTNQCLFGRKVKIVVLDANGEHRSDLPARDRREDGDFVTGFQRLA
jgi:hypothetical protein